MTNIREAWWERVKRRIPGLEWKVEPMKAVEKRMLIEQYGFANPLFRVRDNGKDVGWVPGPEFPYPIDPKLGVNDIEVGAGVEVTFDPLVVYRQTDKGLIYGLMTLGNIHFICRRDPVTKTLSRPRMVLCDERDSIELSVRNERIIKLIFRTRKECTYGKILLKAGDITTSRKLYNDACQGIVSDGDVGKIVGLIEEGWGAGDVVDQVIRRKLV